MIFAFQINIVCGITGQLNFNGRPADLGVIKKMTSVLSHRGPDDEGLMVSGPVGLGHRRLSIIDLSERGRQPMSDQEKRIFVVFNGEIYNFRELRKELVDEGVKFASDTDTEVIIHLYKKHGSRCLRFLDGMFAFAIYDSDQRRLFLARDRVGKKPLKYYIDGKKFIFASELKAILENPGVERGMDDSAIGAYLSLKYVPHPKTGFKNIFKLEPAHYMTVGMDGKIVKERYWDPDFSKKESLSEQAWLGLTEDIIRESVRKRLVSDVPVGSHLSGGLDSGLVTAFMAQEYGKKIKTFSIGFDEKKHNELPYARLVADRYGTDHYELTVKPDAAGIISKLSYYYEEPYADASAIPTWYLAEMTKKYITVALSGDGGDESFAGYERHAALKLYRRFKYLPFKKTLSKISFSLNGRLNAGLFGMAGRLLEADYGSDSDFYASIISYFGEDDRKEACLPGAFGENGKNTISANFRPELDWLDKALYAGIKTHLPDDLLVKADIASMAHGLEIRSPFLDYNLIETAARMPTGMKLRGLEKKYLLKKIALKYLPAECVNRPKHGFTVPLEDWFKGELNDFLKSHILSEKFVGLGFKKEGIENLLREHETGRRNNENRLYSLLMLSLWKRTFFNQ